MNRAEWFENFREKVAAKVGSRTPMLDSIPSIPQLEARERLTRWAHRRDHHLRTGELFPVQIIKTQPSTKTRRIRDLSAA